MTAVLVAEVIEREWRFQRVPQSCRGASAGILDTVGLICSSSLLSLFLLVYSNLQVSIGIKSVKKVEREVHLENGQI